MLLEFAIADAYGAAYEYRPLEYINGWVGREDPVTATHPDGTVTHGTGYSSVLRNDGLTYRRHGGDPAHRPGMPTDDTQMMLAVASVLAFEDRPQTRHFAEAFYALRDHLAPGYSKSMRERFATCESVEEFCEWPQSNGCGGAMRALPAGFLSEVEPVRTPTRTVRRIPWRRHVAEMQHYVTHSNGTVPSPTAARPLVWGSDGRTIQQTEMVVEAAHSAIRGHKWDVAAKPGLDRQRLDPDDVVAQAIHLANVHSGTFEQLLIAACAVGGDTDTRAAIAAGLWSARTGFRIEGNHPLLMEFRGPATHLESIEQLLRKRFL